MWFCDLRLSGTSHRSNTYIYMQTYTHAHTPLVLHQPIWYQVFILARLLALKSLPWLLLSPCWSTCLCACYSVFTSHIFINCHSSFLKQGVPKQMSEWINAFSLQMIPIGTLHHKHLVECIRGCLRTWRLRNHSRSRVVSAQILKSELALGSFYQPLGSWRPMVPF